MITMTESRLQVEKLDQQIFKLLEERMQLFEEARERDEGLDLRVVEVEIISNWVEEASDRGMDEMTVEKIATFVGRLCRSEEE